MQGDISGHLIYTPLQTLAFGAYLGYEGFESFDTFFGGIEGRVDLGDFTAQGYYQIGDSDGTTTHSWGTHASYAIAPGLNFGVFFDNAEFPGAIDYDRYGAGVDYRFNNTFGVFAKAGVIDYSERSGSNETDYGYVEIGGRYIFGGNGKTTFDKRTVFGVAQGNWAPTPIPD